MGNHYTKQEHGSDPRELAGKRLAAVYLITQLRAVLDQCKPRACDYPEHRIGLAYDLVMHNQRLQTLDTLQHTLDTEIQHIMQIGELT